jgi:hypothetical protein
MHLVAAYIDHLAARWISSPIYLRGDGLISRTDGGESDGANDQPEPDSL